MNQRDASIANGVSESTVKRYKKRLPESERPAPSKRKDWRDTDGMLPDFSTGGFSYTGNECDRHLRVSGKDVDRLMGGLETVLQSAGFTGPESRVLSLLMAYEGLTLQEIGKISGMNAMSVKRATDSLVSMRLVNAVYGKAASVGRPYRYISLATDPDKLISSLKERAERNLFVLDEVETAVCFDVHRN